MSIFVYMNTHICAGIYMCVVKFLQGITMHIYVCVCVNIYRRIYYVCLHIDIYIYIYLYIYMYVYIGK
jgi:hypothetical protein